MVTVACVFIILFVSVRTNFFFPSPCITISASHLLFLKCTQIHAYRQINTETHPHTNKPTETNQMCGREQKNKIRPYYLCITLNLIFIDVNVQLRQTENAHLTIPTSLRINYCYLLVLQHSVRIFEITHWCLLLNNTHSLAF